MNSVAQNPNTPRLSGLPKRLVDSGMLSEADAIDAVLEAGEVNKSFVRHIVDTRDVDSHLIAELAASEFGVPLFDISTLNRDSLPDKIVDADLMSKHHAVPLFQRGNRLFIAVSDPTS